MCYDLRDISPTIARLFDIPPHPLWEGKTIDPVVEEVRGTDTLLVMLLDGFGFWEYHENRLGLSDFSRFFDQGVTLKIKSSMYPIDRSETSQNPNFVIHPVELVSLNLAFTVFS